MNNQINYLLLFLILSGLIFIYKHPGIIQSQALNNLSKNLTNTSVLKIPSYQTYANKQFSFKYPTGWEVKDPGKENGVDITDPNSFIKKVERYYPGGIYVPGRYVNILPIAASEKSAEEYLEDQEIPGFPFKAINGNKKDIIQMNGYRYALEYYYNPTHPTLSMGYFYISNGKAIIHGAATNLESLSQHSPEADIVRSITFD